MRPEVAKYIYDIQKACSLISRFAAGKTFAEYAADLLLKSGIERQFEIAGEALSQALKVDPSLAGRMAGANRIVSFRNILIHGYAAVSDEVVWDVVQKHLPRLRAEVDRLLEETGD
jgi:uncharacterized protein with HEPN domain